jgi:hypothetical protein
LLDSLQVALFSPSGFALLADKVSMVLQSKMLAKILVVKNI